VVYVGAATRFVVDLEVGGYLVALQQNMQTSSMDVMEMRGRQVQLIWRREHETAIG
jgi:putative spermidine/putrescine transport system ATP-binding protein